MKALNPLLRAKLPCKTETLQRMRTFTGLHWLLVLVFFVVTEILRIV